MSDIAQAVRDHVKSEYMADRPNTELTDDLNLIDQQIVDSLGIFMIVAFLEEHFGVDIDGDEVNPSNFETVSAITGVVERAKAAS